MSFCDCDIGDCPDVWHARLLRARVAHTCDECGEAIEAGEDYWRTGILFDGHWATLIECEYCHHDAVVVRRAGMCYPLGQLYEAWEDMYGRS